MIRRHPVLQRFVAEQLVLLKVFSAHKEKTFTAFFKSLLPCR
jgi:hypothetical protein